VETLHVVGFKSTGIQGAIVALIVWYLDIQLPMQSVPITTDVVTSNLDVIIKNC
jgi:hypothetical protein